MRLQMFVTADHASIDNATGKTYILGAFSRIYAKEFPARHSSMALVIRVAAELGDSAEEQNLTIALRDEDSVELLKISGPIKIPFGPGGTRPETNVVLEIGNLTFQHPGDYLFTASVNDDEIGSTRLELVQRPG